MTPSSADAPISAADKQVTPDAASLDPYIGYYFRNRALGVSTIARKDTKLVLEPIGQPVMELEQAGEADFAIPKFDLVLCFEQIEEGAAQRLVVWQRGTALRLERTDAGTAKVIKQTIADRVKDRIPAPGSQEALRQMLDTGRAGNPNYNQMSLEFAQVARKQLPYWQIVGQYFGAIVSIEFLRVSNQGWTSTKFNTRMTFISTVSPWAMTAGCTASVRQVLQRTNTPWYEIPSPRSWCRQAREIRC